jgi:hypothetical protein
MKTTFGDLGGLSEVEMSRICGGSDSFARDAGQFIGGALGFVHDNPMTFSTACMIIPPGGFLLAIIAGAQAAAGN